LDRTFLVLGGGGMVGTEVARLILHEISGSFPDGPARVSPRRGEYGNPPGSLGRGALRPNQQLGAWAPALSYRVSRLYRQPYPQQRANQ
jgi:hypothetical protein